LLPELADLLIQLRHLACEGVACINTLRAFASITTLLPFRSCYNICTFARSGVLEPCRGALPLRCKCFPFGLFLHKEFVYQARARRRLECTILPFIIFVLYLTRVHMVLLCRR
jgi:hypothetical protein